jgi:hypothetical protein
MVCERDYRYITRKDERVRYGAPLTGKPGLDAAGLR